MCVTESGIATDASDEQLENAALAICVTEQGIATDVSDEHS